MTVGIVGAGVSGLATHHYLRERGVESVVFESAPEPGGVIRSERVAGRVLDFGPQRTRRTPEIDAMVRELGLEERVREAADVPLYVYHDGALRTAPLSVQSALATDLLSWRGKLRALGELAADPPREGETVAAFFERAFGREAARRVLGPLYAGLYGSRPEEMYAEHTLSKLFENHGVSGSVLVSAARRLLAGETPPAITFDGGMQALPRALYRRHRDGVRLATPVTRLERAGATYRLDADGESVDVDAVVLTTPAGATADVVERVAPASARALRRLRYNPLAVVHLRSSDDLTGAGYQFSLDAADEWHTRGVTWNASLFGRDGGSGARTGMYTCYLGGATRPGAVEWSDRRLRETAAHEFEAVTGRPAEALSVRRLSPGMPAYDTSWTALDGVDLPPGLHLCANYASRAGVPGRVREARRVADAVAETGRNRSQGSPEPSTGASTRA